MLGGILTMFCVALVQLGAMVLLSERTHEAKYSDLIVVFPGSSSRFAVGYRLAHDGYARNFTVINDSLSQLQIKVKRRGQLTGVHLISGGKSRSTFEDVYNTAQIIEKNKLRSVLLLTSSYHIPRAYFLLQSFLLGTGVDIRVYSIPMDHDGTNGSTKEMKLYWNEIVKLWGSTIEMLVYRVRGKLVLDIPFFWDVRQFLKKSVLFHFKSRSGGAT